MERKYKKLLFDLDNTLVDDDENRKYAIEQILIDRKENYNIKQIEYFLELDNRFWKDRVEGKIKDPYKFENNEEKTKWVRAQRFIKFFGNITLNEAIIINEKYMELLKEKIVPIKHANEILKHLHNEGYEIYIITNGPTKAVKNKLKGIDAQEYVVCAFSSEEAGHMKPRREFFDKFFAKIGNSNKKEMLIIGDELEKDIVGGIHNNIDTCWFNPKKLKNNNYKINYEINDLLELKNIL